MNRIAKYVFIALLIFSSDLCLSQSKLLAPVYHGAVSSPLRSDKTQSVFLSKDPIKKIKAFYDSKLGELSTKDPITQSYFIKLLGNTPVVCYGKTILTENQISRKKGYPMPDAKDSGVLLLKKTSSKEENSAGGNTNLNIPDISAGMSDSLAAKLSEIQKKIMQSGGTGAMSGNDMTEAQMSDLFGGLQNEVFLQHHSKKELAAAYKKYKFIETSFFPLVKNGDGELETYPEHLLEEYKNKVKNENPMKDHWKYWTGFLDKLASHAYKTCIIINTDPMGWDK